MTNLLSRSNCNFQSDAKCNRPTFFFINFFGFDPALTNLMEVLQLVFETVYDDKKHWNTEIRTFKTESFRKVNLPCCKANLHAPGTCAVVQIC